MKLKVATPMYGGMGASNYFGSILELTTYCINAKIPMSYTMLDNESLIPRARNKLAQMFLASDCTHLLFWDADLGCNIDDISMMLKYGQQTGYELIGGLYPKKSINWGAIKKAISLNPNITAQELEVAGSEYVFNLANHDAPTTVDLTKPLEVMEVGSGLLLIHRRVFEALMAFYPDLWYTPQIGDHIGSEKPTKMWSFFECGIYGAYDTQAFLSEDYAFCQRWRAMGNKVWMAPWVRTVHKGTYNFVGNFSLTAKTLNGDLC